VVFFVEDLMGNGEWYLKGLWVMVLALLMCIGILWAAPSWAQVDEIRIADSKGDWGYPNPYRHYPRGPGYLRMSWVFETLVWKDDRGYVPALAKSWVYDPERMAFVFDLQKGVRWHDGEPFTAEDVVFTVSYFKKHPYQWVPLDAVAGAEAPDPSRVVIKLKRPYAPFLAYVGGTMPIVPRHIWQTVEAPRRFDAPEAFVGCGPFRFLDFNKAKGTYLYGAFDEYYQGPPKAKRLIYAKAAKPIIALSTGAADLANIQPEMAGVLEKKGMVILENARGWNKKLMINHRMEPFRQKAFRKALAYAINQQEIIDKAHQGLGSPASFGLLSPDHEYYNPEAPTYPHDPAKARQILESLGYEKGASGFYTKSGKPLHIELLTSNITVAGESVRDRDGEVLKRQLGAVGIQVDLVNLEQTTTDVKIRNWDFQLAVSGHGGLLGDAVILERMIEPGSTSGSVNSARYDGNKELLALLKAQMREMDPEKRKALVYRCQEIYADELPAISLYYPASMAAYNPEKGVRWFYTQGGIALGIPIAQNKMSLVR
jgi:peptide/nickel transport system substrate-binding protein